MVPHTDLFKFLQYRWVIEGALSASSNHEVSPGKLLFPYRTCGVSYQLSLTKNEFEGTEKLMIYHSDSWYDSKGVNTLTRTVFIAVVLLLPARPSLAGSGNLFSPHVTLLSGL